MSDHSDKSKSETPGATPTPTATPSSTTGSAATAGNEQQEQKPQKKKSFASYMQNVNKRKQELAEIEKRQKDEQLAREKLAKEKEEEERKKREVAEAERQKNEEEAKKLEERKREKELEILKEIKKREEERKLEEERLKLQADEQNKQREEQEKKLLEWRKEQEEIKKAEERKREEQEQLDAERVRMLEKERKEDERLVLEQQRKDEDVLKNQQTELRREDAETSEDSGFNDQLNKSKKDDDSGSESQNADQQKSQSEVGKAIDKDEEKDLSRLFDDLETQEDGIPNMSWKTRESEDGNSEETTSSTSFSSKDNTKIDTHKYKPSSQKSKGLSPVSANSDPDEIKRIMQKKNEGEATPSSSKLDSGSGILSPGSATSDSVERKLSQVTTTTDPDDVKRIIGKKGRKTPVKETISIEKTPVKEESPVYLTSPLTALPSEATLPPSSIERHYVSKKSDQYPPSIPEASETSRQSIGSPGTEDNQTDADVDSDAETVIGDSPVKPRRGRLIRKSDLENSKSPSVSLTKHIGFNEEELAEIENQRSRKHHSASKSHSRSASPKTAQRKKFGKDSAGRSKLQRACEKGKYDEALSLIEDDADVDDQDNAGNTALHEAALGGHTELVELLLEHGATVDIRSGPEDLDTPLIDAASNYHIEAVKVLLKYGADPRKENASGENALDSLDEEDEDTPVIRELLRRATRYLIEKEKLKEKSRSRSDSEDVTGDDSTRSNNNQRNSSSVRRNDDLLVDLTTKGGRDEIISRATHGDIQFVGTYLNNGGRPYTEALAVAAKSGHTEIVSLLLAFGAKINSYTDKGVTALMLSLCRGHVETVRFLLNAGADPTKLSKEGKKSTLDFATDGLIPNDEEIQLIKEAIEKAESTKKSSKTKSSSRPSSSTNLSSDSEKPRKRKGTPSIEDDTDHKKKKLTKTDSYESISKAKSKDAPKKPNHADSEHREVKRVHSSGSVVELSNKKIKLSTASPRAQSPAPLAQSASAPSTLEINTSIAPANPSASSPVPTPHVETEEEKAARLLKEKKEQEEREQFQARLEAKRKAREQEYLISIENQERLKRQEIEEITKKEQEKQAEEQIKTELKQRQDEERRGLMSKKEEIERRRKIRETYPYGLQIATFNEDRTKEDILKYLPLYVNTIDSVEYVTDLQIIMILGLESFNAKYSSAISTRSLNREEKIKIFNYFYPFLGNFTKFTTTSKQLKDYSDQLGKFKNLQLHWLRLDEVYKIIENDFKPLYDVIRTRTLHIDLSQNKASTNNLVSPSNDSGAATKKPNVESYVKNKNIPIILRLRQNVLKTLTKEGKRLW